MTMKKNLISLAALCALLLLAFGSSESEPDPIKDGLRDLKGDICVAGDAKKDEEIKKAYLAKWTHPKGVVVGSSTADDKSNALLTSDKAADAVANVLFLGACDTKECEGMFCEFKFLFVHSIIALQDDGTGKAKVVGVFKSDLDSKRKAEIAEAVKAWKASVRKEFPAPVKKAAPAAGEKAAPAAPAKKAEETK